MSAKKMFRPSVAAVALLCAFAAHAALSPTEAIKVRHDGFEAIGDAAKGIRDAGVLNAQTAGYAKKIAAAAPQLKDWFPAGSGPEAGIKTMAKAEIWTQPADFAAKREAFAAAADKLAKLAADNDAAAFTAQFAELGKTCKGCHETYRERRN